MQGPADTAELLASELVSNAYRHSYGPCALRPRAAAADRVRVGVWDTNPHIPAPFGGEPAPPAPDAEDGRGLVLVRLSADRYGSYRLDGGYAGKLLWVECGPGLWRPRAVSAVCQWAVRALTGESMLGAAERGFPRWVMPYLQNFRHVVVYACSIAVLALLVAN